MPAPARDLSQYNNACTRNESPEEEAASNLQPTRLKKTTPKRPEPRMQQDVSLSTSINARKSELADSGIDGRANGDPQLEVLRH